jgi:hypothetical protein
MTPRRLTHVDNRQINYRLFPQGTQQRDDSTGRVISDDGVVIGQGLTNVAAWRLVDQYDDDARDDEETASRPDPAGVSPETRKGVADPAEHRPAALRRYRATPA